MINRLFGVLLLLCVTLFSCQKMITPFNKPASKHSFQEYIIPKGEHNSRNTLYQLVNKESMHFQARFDSSCIYSTADIKNSGDINKLYGFSDCGSFHHQNSARVGWVWNGTAVDLYAYCYADSVRSSKKFGTVSIGEEVVLSITPEKDQYIFAMNGKSVAAIKRGCTTPGIAGYQLYPYFGGDETAPNQVHIFIKDL